MATTQNTEYQGGNEVNFGNVYQGVINTMYKNQARIDAERKQEQAKAQEQLKGLQSKMDKIDRNGLQKPDIPKYESDRANMVDAYGKVIESKFSAEALANFNESVQTLRGTIYDSKEGINKVNDAVLMFTKNPLKYQKGTDVWLEQQASLPYNQRGDVLTELGSRMFKGDNTKLLSAVTKNRDTSFASGKYGLEPTLKKRDLAGGWTAWTTEDRKEIDRVRAIDLINNTVGNDPTFRATLDEQYGGSAENFYNANQDLFTQVESKTSSPVKPATIRIDNRGNNAPDYRDIGDSDVIFNNGQSTFKAKNQVDFNEGKVTLTGSSGMFNADTGQPYNITGATQGELMSVMNVPIGKVTSGGGKYSRQGILTPNYTKNSNYKQMGLVKITYKDDLKEVVTDKVYVPIKDVEKVTMTDKKRNKFDSWVNGTKVVSSQPTTAKKATSKSKKGILD